ncbi:transposon Tf2-9 polyprotein [Trichonephila clavipes]|nr:transposon Tf2-9 polyprotein [Trichonephila clavipes]
MKERRTPERRNSSRPRNRSRNRSFSRSRESCCWYHKKFQERAKKFIPPCSYKEKNESSEEEFPEIVKPPSFSQEVKHNIKHFIETSGPPVFAKARRLAPDRLKIAKSEFQHMLNLGHVRPSKKDRVEAILKFPKPTTITQLRRFLGMLNYYRRFIRQAAHILSPLVKFLEGIRNKKTSKAKDPNQA